MRFIKHSAVIITIFASFYLNVYAQADWQQQWLSVLLNPPPSTLELRQKTFEEVWKTVYENHYDENFHGVDWNKIHDTYAPKATQTRTNEELAVLLNQMLGELKQSHNEVFLPKEILQKGITGLADTGITAKLIDNSAVIVKIEADSPAQKSVLRQGFVIERIDNIPIEQIIAEKRRENPSPEELEETVNLELRKRLRGDAKSKVRLVFTDEKDKSHTTTLERVKKKGEVTQAFGIAPLLVQFEAKRLDEGRIGYISFSNFFGVAQKVADAVGSMNDASAIILDLRNNGGGDTKEMNAVAGLFFDKLTSFAKVKTRKGFEVSFDGIAIPAPNNFKGRLVILINSSSASASEMLAAGFQEIGRATVVGEKSAGDLLISTPKLLPNASVQMFTKAAPVTLKGTMIESRGVIPDIEIKPTRAMLLRGEDPELAAALKFIRENSDNSNQSEQNAAVIKSIENEQSDLIKID